MSISIPNAQICFGDRVAYYPDITLQDWIRRSVQKRRPEQDGADIIRFGKTPVEFTGIAVLFATTFKRLLIYRNRWQKAVGTIEDLKCIGAGGTATMCGCFFQDVSSIEQPKRTVNATNGASWMMRIRLTFARVMLEAPA